MAHIAIPQDDQLSGRICSSAEVGVLSSQCIWDQIASCGGPRHEHGINGHLQLLGSQRIMEELLQLWRGHIEHGLHQDGLPLHFWLLVAQNCRSRRLQIRPGVHRLDCSKASDLDTLLLPDISTCLDCRNLGCS